MDAGSDDGEYTGGMDGGANRRSDDEAGLSPNAARNRAEEVQHTAALIALPVVREIVPRLKVVDDLVVLKLAMPVGEERI